MFDPNAKLTPKGPVDLGGDPASDVIRGIDGVVDDGDVPQAPWLSQALGPQGGLTAKALQKSLFWRSYLAKPHHDAYIEVLAYHDSVADDGKILTAVKTEKWREFRFVLSDIQMPKSERLQIMRTFGEDRDFLITYGRDSMVWSFSGVLRNERDQDYVTNTDNPDQQTGRTARGDWVSAFDRRYQLQLRASVLARERKVMRLAIGDMSVDGYMMNLQMNRSGNGDDAMVPFSFQMLVKDYSHVNRTPDDSFFAGLRETDGDPATDPDPTLDLEWSAFVRVPQPDPPAQA